MIRKITNNDRNKIYNILKKEFKVNYKNDNPFTKWYIYETNGIITGFINIDIIYEKAEIEYIYVTPDFRNQNIATELLEYIQNNFKELKNITLEVNEKNYIAINFYKKNGFEQVAIRECYYGNDNAFLMLKKLVKE